MSDSPTSPTFVNRDPVHLLREELYGTSTPTAAAGHRNMVFSYASPEVVRQAKLEAMEMKIRLKMAENKAASGDHAALKELTGGKSLDLSHLTHPTAGKGTRDQLKSLVMPPEVTEHGDEKRGTSKLILDGQRRDYMRVGDGRPTAETKRGVDPYFRANDHAYDVSSRKQGRRSATGVRKKKAPPMDPIMQKLHQGMLAYVPVKVQKPEGVARNAFVSQAQAIEEARAEYDMVRGPRIARTSAGGTFKRSSGGGGMDSSQAQAHPNKPPPLFLHRVASSAQRTSDDAGAASVYSSDKYKDVPMVKVQEVDLFAQYRTVSQKRLVQQQAAAGPQPQPQPEPTRPDQPMRMTVRTESINKSTPPAAAAATAAAAAPPSGSQPHASEPPQPASAPPAHAPNPFGRPPRKALSLDNSAMQQQPSAGAAGGAATAPAADAGARLGWNGRPASPKKTHSMQERPAYGTTTVTASGMSSDATKDRAQGPGSERGGSATAAAAGNSKPSAFSNSPLKPRVSTAAQDAAERSAERSGAAMGKPPRPAASPARTSSGSGAWAQSSGGRAMPTAAAAGASVSPVRSQARPASFTHPRSMTSPAHRPTSALSPTRQAHAHQPLLRATSSGPVGMPHQGEALYSRSQYHPPDPEQRRSLQLRPGSALHIAKTNNRLRSSLPSEGSWGALEASPPSGSPRWGVDGQARSSSLQERVLQYTARQYLMTVEEIMESQRGVGAASPGLQPKPFGMTAAEAAASLQTMQRTTNTSGSSAANAAAASTPAPMGTAQGNARPQSAPSRRMRPPSAGQWAGRPAPETFLTASLQRSAHGLVYDPALQPGPVERMYPAEPEGY